MDPHDIMVENFRECLRSYQRSIVWTATASFVFFLFAFDLAEGRVVNTGWTEIPIWAAWGLALLAYAIFSWHAMTCLDRAAGALTYFLDRPRHLEALCKFPSLATHPNRFARLGLVVISPLLLLAGLLVRLGYEGSLDDGWTWLGVALFTLPIVAIPVTIASRLRRWGCPTGC